MENDSLHSACRVGWEALSSADLDWTGMVPIPGSAATREQDNTPQAFYLLGRSKSSTKHR